MKTIAIALLALLLLASAPANATLLGVFKEPGIACLSKKDLTDAYVFLRAGDRAGHRAFSVSQLRSGRCLIVPQGTRVFIDNVGWDGLNAFRVIGTQQPLFIEREYLQVQP
jgi:hypothetical protein